MNTRIQKSGFTLIEMLLVIGVLGVLMAMTLQSFNEPTQEAMLDNSYATVITTLESARTKALQGVGDGSSGQTVTVSSDGKKLIIDGGEIYLPASISIDETDTIVDFTRITGASSATTLTITNRNGDTRTVTVTDEGYVY